MKLDVRTLGTFYEMARQGAGLAADRLTKMTEVESRVGVTRMNFMTGTELRAELDDGHRKAAIRVPLTSGFEGDSMLVYDEASARVLVQTLTEDVPRDGVRNMGESALVEVSQIMNSGFVDGWADVLGVGIDIDAPEYIAGRSPDRFLDSVSMRPGDDDLVLVFQSHIETLGTEITFDHYLFPEREAVANVLERRANPDEGIDYDKLVGFNRMAEQGASEVAANLSQLTGIDMTVDVRRINFLSLDTIPEEVPNEELVSVSFRFDGTPSGYLVFVFDRQAATTLVEAALGGADLDDGFGEMGRDALSEFGNVMASGFLDGWANVLDTTIEHTTPRYARDLGAAVVDPLIIGLSRSQEFAFVFDTQVTAADTACSVSVYAIPDEDSLERALDELDLRMVGRAPTTAEFSFGDVETRAADVASVDEVTEGSE